MTSKSWDDPNDPGMHTTSKWDQKCADCGRMIKTGEPVVLRNRKAHCPEHETSGSTQQIDEKTSVTVNVAPLVIPDGHYALVNNTTGEVFVVRIHTVHQASSSMNGKTLASIKDEDEWKAFAFVGDDGKIHPWKKYSDHPEWTAAAEALLDPDLQRTARERYENKASLRGSWG